MKKLVLLLVAIFLTSCGASKTVKQVGANGSDTEIKKYLNNLSNKTLNYFVSGEVDNYLKGYSSNVIDLGGGPKGDGSMDLEKFRIKLKKFVTSDKFIKKYKKPIKELFLLDSKKIMNYDEYIAIKGKTIKRFSFEFKKGDYYLTVPPSKKSPMRDGWFGIYRFENGKWKIIATD